jgi:HEAT repeat protein
MKHPTGSTARLVCLASLLCLVVSFVAMPARAAGVIDSPMYRDPDVPASRYLIVYSDKPKKLWLKALARPEADLKRKAAEVIVLAHRNGVKGLESTVAPLSAVLEEGEDRAVVRLAVARALIALDARSTAAILYKSAKAGDADLRDQVEVALARWDYRPIREMWLARLGDPAVRPRDLMLAIRCLGSVREKRAADRFRELMLSDRTLPSVRLHAARALGAVRGEGLEKDAGTLAEDTSRRGIPSRLSAVGLLRRHSSKEAVALLQRLSRDREPAVTAVAVARLLEIDSKLALPALDHLLASPDASVRSFGVEVLFRHRTEKHVRLLGERLDDLHPDVRMKARGSLYELASKKELRQPIIDVAMEVLGRVTGSWRGLEQAAILLTQLDHKPAARRLLELLESDRAEVYVTAGWGLRKLAVRDMLPGVLSYVNAELSRQMAGASRKRGAMVDHQLSQLNQFMGQQRYAEADRVLQRFIPHLLNPIVDEARAAAIHALGLIHQGKKAPAGLVKALLARLADVASMPPEDARVRQMSAITLGRLKAKEALELLKRFGPSEPRMATNPLPNSCAWAVSQITGEKMPPAETIRHQLTLGFLVPLD